MIKVVLLDFGGVISEEGFKEGLFAIARKHSLNEEEFYLEAKELIFKIAYVEGKVTEEDYFTELKNIFKIQDDTETLKNEILSRFELRDEVIEWVIKLRANGFKTGILSDQTNWLCELNEKEPFFVFFDYIFNSYSLGKTKRDPSLFGDIVMQLGVKAEELLFVDDDPDNIKRAKSFGIHTILYSDYEDFNKKMRFFSEIGD